MELFASTAANISTNILLLVTSVLFLWKGAGTLVESAARIAARFGISEVVIGLTVVAIGTSAPEFAVTVNAALKGQADISVGNVVGSNIFNIGFILGSVAMVRAIATGRAIVYRDGFFMIAITLLLLLFLADMRLDRVEGGILMALLVAYMLMLFIKKEKMMQDDHGGEKRPPGVRDYFMLPLGIAAVIAGGHFLVESSVYMARAAGISEWIIGVTVVAAGTSAPEMAASLAASLKGKQGMSAGNLIGSNIFNTLGVLGLAGLLRPMGIDRGALLPMILLLAISCMVVLFMRTGWSISRREGAILFAAGILIWVLDFVF